MEAEHENSHHSQLIPFTNTHTYTHSENCLHSTQCFMCIAYSYSFQLSHIDTPHTMSIIFTVKWILVILTHITFRRKEPIIQDDHVSRAASAEIPFRTHCYFRNDPNNDPNESQGNKKTTQEYVFVLKQFRHQCVCC